MKNLKELLFETLECLGGKKKGNCIEFLEPDLLIKHKECGVKYTIEKIGISKKTKKPLVVAYRYYGPSNKKYYIKIQVKDFGNYTPV